MITFLKTLHISCAALSFLGFVLRAGWMWCESPLLQHRLSKILPHLIDTLLLASALALLWQYGLSPLHQPWLMGKIVALFVYIALGTLALKRGKTPMTRRVAAGLAIVCFGYIVSAAVTKSPWGYVGWL